MAYSGATLGGTFDASGSAGGYTGTCECRISSDGDSSLEQNGSAAALIGYNGELTAAVVMIFVLIVTAASRASCCICSCKCNCACPCSCCKSCCGAPNCCQSRCCVLMPGTMVRVLHWMLEPLTIALLATAGSARQDLIGISWSSLSYRSNSCSPYELYSYQQSLCAAGVPEEFTSKFGRDLDTAVALAAVR
jgi:hypothetical protein